ncbi:hypothetical protein DBV15_05006 [Temnothorax longispinosus]|uniref:Uncharacterized protein n=1 Tax=Temnothorax longispinosus TaxID=300112 RepID=A0A4S2KIM5_9HYME|nr:hypothetical protein DBV15_05006 [Temnothorax longispinosus]
MQQPGQHGGGVGEPLGPNQPQQQQPGLQDMMFTRQQIMMLLQLEQRVQQLEQRLQQLEQHVQQLEQQVQQLEQQLQQLMLLMQQLVQSVRSPPPIRSPQFNPGRPPGAHDKRHTHRTR